MYHEIDKDKQITAGKYFFSKFIISKISSFFSLIFIILVIFFGISEVMSAWINDITRKIVFYRTIYFFLFFNAFYLLSLPFSYINSYKTEHRFGFSNQSLGSWILDQFKGYLVSLILGLIITHVLYIIINSFPGSWWIWISIIMLIFSVILQHLAPVLLIPIFYKLEKLEDDTLKEKLLQLAKKAHINIIGVFIIKLSEKTKKANAALTGIGSTRRILLGDTLLNEYDFGEIETVIAHELGHHIHKHISKMIIIESLITMISMYMIYRLLPDILNLLQLGQIGDIGSLPGFILLCGFISFLFSPVMPFLSRKMETEADLTACKLSGKPEKFISVMVKFANNYLSLAYPPKIIEILEYDHPPIGKRIHATEIFMRSNRSEENV